MNIITIGEFWRDPLDDADRHEIALRLDTLQFCVLVRQGVVRLTEYVAAHPERTEPIRQAIRDRFRG